jgi:hypothetical protein
MLHQKPVAVSSQSVAYFAITVDEFERGPVFRRYPPQFLEPGIVL